MAQSGKPETGKPIPQTEKELEQQKKKQKAWVAERMKGLTKQVAGLKSSADKAIAETDDKEP